MNFSLTFSLGISQLVCDSDNIHKFEVVSTMEEVSNIEVVHNRLIDSDNESFSENRFKQQNDPSLIQKPQEAKVTKHLGSSSKIT